MARVANTPYSVRAGAYLKRLLKAQGYTQERFAEEFGVSARHVRRWESDGINQLDTLQQILDFFGMSMRDILLDGDIPVFFLPVFQKNWKAH